jgi:lipopolysaccharide/colanic/teichoic acid biosynthesis glycosyltransferase
MKTADEKTIGTEFFGKSRPVTFGVKRLMDIVGAGLLFITLAPVFALIAMVVALDGGPVLYNHRRIGKNGVPFDCLKFRTMMVGADTCLDEYLTYHPLAGEEWARDQKLSFDPRITPIGKLLRQTSLDELPQLFNVVKGDMSLVGPRPITEGELRHYGASAMHYLSVRPGITGLWQISGRNDVSYQKRVVFDRNYVEGMSLWQDLVILSKTPSAVLSRRGAR